MSNATAFWSAVPDADVGADYIHSESPLKAVRKIVVKGSVDVFFLRSNENRLLVSGKTQEAVDGIKTSVKGDKLIIENEGFIGVSVGGIHYSTGRGSIHIGSLGGGVHISAGKGAIHIGGAVQNGIGARGVVGIALPSIGEVSIKGSGDVTLLDLQQAGIEFEIQGSGDITAFGQVGSLDVSIAGSGDVDVSDLICERANLSIAGSGDIVVRGNPGERSKSVAGSGSVKFK